MPVAARPHSSPRAVIPVLRIGETRRTCTSMARNQSRGLESERRNVLRRTSSASPTRHRGGMRGPPQHLGDGATQPAHAAAPDSRCGAKRGGRVPAPRIQARDESGIYRAPTHRTASRSPGERGGRRTPPASTLLPLNNSTRYHPFFIIAHRQRGGESADTVLVLGCIDRKHEVVHVSKILSNPCNNDPQEQPSAPE